MTALHILALCVLLHWALIMTAAAIRHEAWIPANIAGMFGNRDDLPDPSPLAGRAMRTAANMQENMILFAPLVLAATVASADPGRVMLGAWIFLAGRVLHAAAYYAGIPYARTGFWFLGVVGMAVIGASIFGI